MMQTFYTQAIRHLLLSFLLLSQVLVAQIDTVPPLLECKSGVNVELLPSGFNVIIVDELIDTLSDNVNNQSEIEVTLCVSCDTFPSQGGLWLDCSHAGLIPMTVWARDIAGNISQCSTNLFVNLGMAECLPKLVSGAIKYAYSNNSDSPVAPCIDSVVLGVEMKFLSQPNISTQFTLPLSTDGNYSARVLSGTIFEARIKPISDSIGTASGIDLLDALRIQRHILGLQPLVSPYRLLAADVNGSKSITSSDVAEIRKRVLGVIDQFKVPVYQFVNLYHIFPNPSNPFVPRPPDSSNFSLPASWNAFLMFKSGDVTGNGCTMFAGDSDERNGSLACLFEDQYVQAGETFKVSIKPNTDIDALQLTLNHPNLRLSETTESMSSLTSHITRAVALLGETNHLEFSFLAEADGWISDLLQVDSETSYAIDQKDQRLAVEVYPKTTHQQLRISPNPFSQAAVVQYHLPKAQKVIISVFDPMGRLVHMDTIWQEAGLQAWSLNGNFLSAQGWNLVQIATESDIMQAKAMHFR